MRSLCRISLIVLSVYILSCSTQSNDETLTEETKEINPPAEGFNFAESDSTAIVIADSVMKAMGGRKEWDSLRYIKWNFFGARDLIWDKQTGRVRIDYPRDSSIYLINILDNTGRVMQRGNEVTHPDSLKEAVSTGKSIWINDSYWLVMPFKLKDSGVTLKYLREDTTARGTKAHVLQLTFDNIGDTPDNKYEVFVDQSDYLVKQWSYFRTYEQDSASAIWPWDNYNDYNGVLLSADRSDNRGPRDLRTYDSIPDTVFESFETPKLD